MSQEAQVSSGLLYPLHPCRERQRVSTWHHAKSLGLVDRGILKVTDAKVEPGLAMYNILILA